MARGDKPIKLGDSWFSAKHIEVWGVGSKFRGREIFGLRES